MARPQAKFEIRAIDKSLAGIRSANKNINSMLKPIRNVQRGLKELSRASGLANIGRSLVGVGRQFTRLAGVAGIAVGGVLAAVNKFAGAGDNIAKTADKLGVGIEALQELRFAADRSGVEIRTFDLALQRFTRRAAEAAAGTGEAKKALEFLKITLKDSNGVIRPTTELLSDVADRMKNIEDPALRLRIAFKLFDSEGAKLVNLLKDGSENMSKLRKEARDLGLVMDEKAARASEKFVDAMTNTKAVLTGVFNVIGSKLLPVLQPLVEKFSRFVLRNKDLIALKIGEFIKELVVQMRSFGEFMANVGPPVLRFIRNIGGLKTLMIATAAIIAGPLISAVVALGVALTATPIGLVIIGISAAVTAAIAIWSAFGDEIKAVVALLRDSVFDKLSAIGDFFSTSSSTSTGGRRGGRSAIAPPVQTINQQSQASVNGIIKLEIDAVGNARVKEIKSETPGLGFNVDAGIGFAD